MELSTLGLIDNQLIIIIILMVMIGKKAQLNKPIYSNKTFTIIIFFIMIYK